MAAGRESAISQPTRQSTRLMRVAMLVTATAAVAVALYAWRRREKAAAKLLAEKAAAEATAAAEAKAAEEAAAAAAAAKAAVAAANAELERRSDAIDAIIPKLGQTVAGSEERLTLVKELAELLQEASERPGKQQRKLCRAFVDAGGPETLYHLESSMAGNWVLDAKNGTLKHLSNMSRLPGTIGAAICAHRRVAEKNKLDAAHQLGCQHPDAHGPPPGSTGVAPA